MWKFQTSGMVNCSTRVVHSSHQCVHHANISLTAVWLLKFHYVYEIVMTMTKGVCVRLRALLVAADVSSSFLCVQCHPTS